MLTALIGPVTGLLDKFIPDADQKAKLAHDIATMSEKHAQELALAQINVNKEEAKGNWLQRSWRPILMLGFGFIVMYNKFFAPAFGLPNAELEGEFWNLLQLGVGGYVIGRSAEKIAKDVVNKK